MSILKKPYEISVWEDVFLGGNLTERRIGVIGTDAMQAQCRAIEPILVRNVNGTKSLTFKMYKQYIDNFTGEKTINPFIDWLTNERKVKLKYDNIWYDFVIKDINETSTSYLYSYTLEDALVQELSKNGFGVTLDAELMNNVGNARELGEKVLEETDWNIDSETFVQTVEDALVYATMPQTTDSTLSNYLTATRWDNIKIYQIIDQQKDDLYDGVTEHLLNDAEKNALQGKTILAFYSSCKNKPHRFQFIYSNKGYNKDEKNNYAIKRLDDRVIAEENCQYFIDFEDQSFYLEPSADNGTLNLNLYLPRGFSVGIAGRKIDSIEGTILDTDSQLSSWYKGKRYGFSQQSIYVPVLEKYCQKFEKDQTISIEQNSNFKIYNSAGETNEKISWTSFGIQNGKASFNGNKRGPTKGYYFDLNYVSANTYILKYKIQSQSASKTLKNIACTSQSFNSYISIKRGNEVLISSNGVCAFSPALANQEIVEVEVKCNKIDPGIEDAAPWIFIQPNYGLNDEVDFYVSDLELFCENSYLGYTESTFVSPTLIQNCITNYDFKNSSGWMAEKEDERTSERKPSVESVYGTFDGSGNFSTIVEDFLNDTYSEEKAYKSYLKVSTYDSNNFVLNSGIKDNRTLIEEMPEGEEWVLDYKILNSQGSKEGANKFSFSLGEYFYNSNYGYSYTANKIAFSSRNASGNELLGLPSDANRLIFKVDSTSYNKQTFKKNSKVYLKIQPLTTATEEPIVWYIEKIRLYRKVIGDNGQIIMPDLESGVSAEEYVSSGTIEQKYHYFSSWLVDKNNPNRILQKDALPTITFSTLSYKDYLPVYNTGAEKVRTITASESNYFNILQSIAETFEAWLELVVEREDDGTIISKTARFKNYIGKDNYASFRYGVNLKDIQRNINTKNIVTKLIVKANSNKLAKNGFCTIQRAGANPTGENCIYDFQYYQNQGIMDVEDFLQTAYFLDGATGEDYRLWLTEDSNGSPVEGAVQSGEYTLKGYYQRIKKINEAITPLNENIINYNSDLLKKEAQLETSTDLLEAASQGLEEVREDFRNLNGLYPEEAKAGTIVDFNFTEENAVVQYDNWWQVVSKSKDGANAYITIEAKRPDKELSPLVQPGSQTTLKNDVSDDRKKIMVNSAYGGLCLQTEYTEGQKYILSYKLIATDGILKNIGWNADACSLNSITLSIKESNGSIPAGSWSANKDVFTFDLADGQNNLNKTYCITIEGEFAEGYTGYIWIQPNRFLTDEVTCDISKIKLYEIGTGDPTSDQEREIFFYLNTLVEVGDESEKIPRTFAIEGKLPAGESRVTLSQSITAIDLTRSDVQKDFEEYCTYKITIDEETDKKSSLENEIFELKTILKNTQDEQENLLKYKKELNHLFFQKYSRFIQEGTWLSEEYVDDDKYYADAQAVLYNSCYPQITYNINVLSLRGIPGYELIDFDLGDKTKVVDDEFFGEDYQEEVIVGELSENLDDQSKNTIKVQNFKNQFQDLFQRITATVQQAQYSAGSYEKGAAFMEATEQERGEFISNSLNSAAAYLAHGQTVESNSTGITITDNSNKQNKLRLVGGAILFSTLDEETQEQTWKTGITSEGMSANLIRAGAIDTALIQIKAGDTPTFRWDAFGLSAYDAVWRNSLLSGADPTLVSANTRKFVRFDKHGIYGISDAFIGSTPVDGAHWRPENIGEIEYLATFALTWEGLKVSGNEGVEVNIGKQNDSVINITKTDSNNKTASIFKVTNSGNLELVGTITGSVFKDSATNPNVYLSGTALAGQTINGASNLPLCLKVNNNFGVTSSGILYANGANITGTITSSSATITGGSFNVADNFIVDSSGNVTLNGNITWGASASPTQVLYNESGSATKPIGKYSTFVDGTGGWYKTIGTRKYASYTYDGGNTWGPVIKIIGDDGDKYEIGPNGNWLLNGSDTGKQALGEDGDPITITGTYYASSSSNTTPGTYGDNGAYPTTLNKDNPYLWTKTTFSDGSHVEQVTQVIMTRDGLFSMLEGEDGIYKDPTDGTIAIKAEAIKTGALLIGSTDNELFYANVESPTVRIAGWGISATELTNGNLKLYGATNNKTTSSLVADGNSKVVIEAGEQAQTKTQQESVTIGSDWAYCTNQEREQNFEYTLEKQYDQVVILSYNPIAEAECPCGHGETHYVTDRSPQMSCQYDKSTNKIVGKIVSNIFKDLGGGRYQTNIIYMGFYESEITEPTFGLLEDGSMYANAVCLQGLLKSGHISFRSEESTTTFREPVSYRGASTFVYTGQPVLVTKFSLTDVSKEGTIDRINSVNIDDYFSETTESTGEVVYTIKSGVDFQLSPGDIFHYNKSLSDQSDLSITGFYMNNGVVETTSLGDVLLNGKSLTNTIAKLTQEVYDIKAKVGLL